MRIHRRLGQQPSVGFEGSSGINFGIADAFTAQGALVTMIGRQPENVVEAIEQLSHHGHGVAGFSADVRNFSNQSAAC